MNQRINEFTVGSSQAQWIFCNNHDNWRLQSLTGKEELKMCAPPGSPREFRAYARLYRVLGGIGFFCHGKMERQGGKETTTS